MDTVGRASVAETDTWKWNFMGFPFFFVASEQKNQSFQTVASTVFQGPPLRMRYTELSPSQKLLK